MTDDTVAELKRHVERLDYLIGGTYIDSGEGYREAKRHLERALILAGDLERERADLQEIAQAVASVPDVDYFEECPFCRERPEWLPIVHKPECPVSKARALLAADVPTQSDAPQPSTGED